MRQRLTGGGTYSGGADSVSMLARPPATTAVPRNSQPAEAQSTPAAAVVPTAVRLPVAWHMAGTACTPAAAMEAVQPLAYTSEAELPSASITRVPGVTVVPEAAVTNSPPVLVMTLRLSTRRVGAACSAWAGAAAASESKAAAIRLVRIMGSSLWGLEAHRARAGLTG